MFLFYFIYIAYIVEKNAYTLWPLIRVGMVTKEEVGWDKYLQYFFPFLLLCSRIGVNSIWLPLEAKLC